MKPGADLIDRPRLIEPVSTPTAGHAAARVGAYAPASGAGGRMPGPQAPRAGEKPPAPLTPPCCVLPTAAAPAAAP